MVLPPAPSISTPFWSLPRTRSPSSSLAGVSVPIVLPRTRLPVAPDPEITTPSRSFSKMRLLAPAAVPPIVFSAPSSIEIPS